MSAPAIAKPRGKRFTAWILIGGVTAVHCLVAAVSFLKDLTFAAYFGTSQAADLVTTAFLLPEAISYNLIAAVIGIAAVPELSRRWQEKQYGMFLRSAARMALHAALLMTGALLLLFLAKNGMMALFGYGPGSAGTGELERLYVLLLFSMPLFPLFAIGGAALQASGAFYAAAAGPIVLNAAMLAALSLSWAGNVPEQSGSFTYAASILAGAGGMTLMVWAALRRRLRLVAQLSFASAWRQKDNEAAVTAAVTGKSRMAAGGLLRVYRDILPLLLLNLFSQMLYATERAIAANMEPGTLAGLNYAYRIAQFPNWVFVAAVTAVLLPALSRSASAGGGQAAKPELYRALRATLGLMLPAAAVLFWLREPVISLLFGRGAFGPQSVALTSELLAGYSLSVALQAVSVICLRYFLACGRLYGPAAVYLASTVCTIAFDLLAVRSFGAAALGYGALCGWALNALLMFMLVVRDSNNRSG
ncbi:oligosaccharide flippase family protein [Paenibacillus sp. N4]|uniref:murein biosynthesis integral membrane protein MurJ n=1 Tax=Paenibacillus vietnamensis TaxID=2590547 RepID=UPI001CD1626C|nr:lipid II flippase MurJ [Paenibacillus vietnamensis]MCA0756657.1 oligosaccharide flippase family protein [Paenibacillus vietnamensis]